MKFVIFKDKAGEYRWRMLANNNQIIATSGEGYKAKSDCEHGVELVKTGAASATTVDESGN